MNLFSTKKEEFLKITSRSKFSKPVIVKGENEEETQEFSSITAAVNFLKNKDIQVNRDQITKWLNTGKPYKGYIFSRA